MDAPVDQVLEQMVQIEQTAEGILADKQQLVDLDRRRQQIREAQRQIYKQKDDKKQWVCFGNQFIKLPKTTTKAILDKDFTELENELIRIRKDLKPKMNKLRDLEHKEELKGFNLKALSKEDLRKIKGML